MNGLPEQKIEIVRTLVRSAPDRVVGNLQAALAGVEDAALLAVRRLVEAEADDRRLRNRVLAPIAPMCVGDGRAADRLTFPAQALSLLWRGLQAEAGREIARLAASLADLPSDLEPPTAPFDALAARAAAGLRSRTGAYATAADLADGARSDGAVLLAGCLDLAPVVRAGMGRLPDWINPRGGEEAVATARLAYKDAVRICEESGPQFFEMLAAQLAQPWMVLRIIAAVMDKPPEAYLSGSELASFGLRVLDEIDEGLAHVGRFDPAGGKAAARGAAEVVERITHQIGEFEDCIELTPERGWGARLTKQKKALARAVEGRLRETQKAVRAALPTTSRSLGARLTKNVPRLTDPIDPAAATRALTLAAFVDAIRTSADRGGFGAMRAKLLDELADEVDHYVEEVLDLLRHDEVEDREGAKGRLAVAADLTGLIRDRRARDVVRRRAAAA